MIYFLKKYFWLLLTLPLGIFNVPKLTAQQPNILFIAIDDLKPVLNCYGESQIYSPNIDKLAEKGVVFNRAYCQWPVCGPSRASILTGLTPDGSGIRNLSSQLRDVNPDVVSLPQYFKNLGYTTAAAGKVFDRRNVDAGHDSLSWSVAYTNPNKYSYPAEYPGFVKGKKYRVTANTATEMGPEGIGFDGYEDGQICLDGLAKLDELSKNPEQPFFLAVGFKKPHVPFVAPKEYWDLYDRNEIDLASFQKIAVGSPEYAYFNPEPFGYVDIPDIWTFSDIEMGDSILHPDDQRKLIHGYYACVSYIDDLVGKLLNKLEEKGLDDNTIVVFWGDHGYQLGDHNQWGKHTNFENALRVPLIIYKPGIVPGTSNALAEFTDVYPTLVNLAGQQIPSYLQGYDLTSVLYDTPITKTCAVTEYRSSGHSSYSFRIDSYRLTLWNNSSENRPDVQGWDTSKFLDVELYDYVADSLETINLYSSPDYSETLDSMMAIARNWWYNQNYFFTNGHNPAYIPGFNYILNNPGLEDSIDSSWTSTLKNGFSAQLTNSASSNSGTNALLVSVTNPGTHIDDGAFSTEYYQCMPSLRSKKVYVSCYAKSSDQDNEIRFNLQVMHFNGNEESFPGEIISLTNNYDSISFVLNIPTSAEQWKVSVEFGTSTGNFLLDDFRITVDQNKNYSNIKDILCDEMVVYPNPAKDLIHLNFTPKEDTRIRFFNMQGQLIKDSGVTSNIINIHDLQDGTYIIQIFHENKIFNKKITVTK